MKEEYLINAIVTIGFVIGVIVTAAILMSMNIN